jgi:ABC-2 type transport system ATP-binding protein
MVSIEARNLRKRFGELVAVDDVTFEVADGESFGVLGPNGAGKSTLIRLLTTLLLPTGGTARVAGRDVLDDPDGVRRSIGVVPQAVTSDPKLTAAENLDFCARLHGVPRAERRRRIDELLEWIRLTEWRDKLVGTFSGGMRRRVEIARSLIHEPRILFLDEPTTGLDPASRVAMWEMLRLIKARRGITVLLTTHYLEEAEQSCDRLAIVDEGRLVAIGTAAELKAMLPTRDSIEVSFVAPPPGWGEQLAALPGVESAEVADGGWRIHCLDRARALTAVVQAAGDRGLEISALTLKETTLQDVFIHFTGRDVRDAAHKLRLDSRLIYEG